jgi:hypothetical protein
MSHPQQETKQEALTAPKIDIVKGVFPILSILMLMLHISIFSFLLPLPYYLIGITLSLLSLKDTFNGHLEQKKTLGFSFALFVVHLFFSLKMPFSASFQLIALGWISSFIIGVLGQNVAILEGVQQRRLAQEKEDNYQVALKGLRDQIKTQDTSAKQQSRLFEAKYQIKTEENSEINKLLEQNRQQYQAMHVELGQLKTIAKTSRDELITLKGQLSEKQLLLKESQQQEQQLKKGVSKLQNEANYYRVEHEHRGAMFDVLALKEEQNVQKAASQKPDRVKNPVSTQEPVELETKPTPASPPSSSSPQKEKVAPVESTSFAHLIAKLTKDQQQYQTAFKACSEEMAVLKKQLKGKKKEPELEQRLKEKEERTLELKGKLNDINRKIFILKKQQIEEEKTAPVGTL